MYAILEITQNFGDSDEPRVIAFALTLRAARQAATFYKPDRTLYRLRHNEYAPPYIIIRRIRVTRWSPTGGYMYRGYFVPGASAMLEGSSFPEYDPEGRYVRIPGAVRA